MIKRVNISGIHMEPSADAQKYVLKKISKLDRYIPKHARKSVHYDVKLKESKLKTKKQITCEVIISLPNEDLAAKETTMNLYAAVDIVEQKLKVQLKKYKDLHVSARAGHKDGIARSFLGKLRSKRA